MNDRKSVLLLITGNQRMIALYCRLSRDDVYHGDSASIQTQKKMLEQYAEQNKFDHLKLYIDDGYSGTSFDRTGYQVFITDIKEVIVDTLITKDVSTLVVHAPLEKSWMDGVPRILSKKYSIPHTKALEWKFY